jgi:predicted NUDIX family NTP pyrophosphohydrolase
MVGAHGSSGAGMSARPVSAGVLLFRRPAVGLEVLLGHLGGPFWAAKDAGAWSIPKGEVSAGEAPFAAARREFTEEMGTPPPSEGYLDLGELSTGRKQLHVWAVEHDFDANRAVSNTFTLEWPPRSGRMQDFPEIDRAAWWAIEAARERLAKGQQPYLDRLVAATDPGGVTHSDP